MNQIERKSSIDREPRALNFDEIQYAREAALFVLKNRSFEEALRIFTEGLKPVGACAMAGLVSSDMVVAINPEEEMLDRRPQSHPPLICSMLKDIVSAPF